MPRLARYGGREWSGPRLQHPHPGARNGPEGQRSKWAGSSLAFPLEGTREEEDDDDYENMAPPYKDLPPKPGKNTSQRPEEEGCGLRAGGVDRSPGDISWTL